MARAAAALTALIIALGSASGAAKADLKLCNKTESRVGVALGYKDKEGWASEGWWNIGANNCETLLRGPLIARYYYIFAVDYDKGGSWGGKAMMCKPPVNTPIAHTEPSQNQPSRMLRIEPSHLAARMAFESSGLVSRAS